MQVRKFFSLFRIARNFWNIKILESSVDRATREEYEHNNDCKHFGNIFSETVGIFWKYPKIFPLQISTTVYDNQFFTVV